MDAYFEQLLNQMRNQRLGINNNEPTILGPDTLHRLSALTICKSVIRIDDLLSLPLAGSQKYFLVNVFVNRKNLKKEHLKQEYTDLLIEQLGYIIEPLEDEIRKNTARFMSSHLTRMYDRRGHVPPRDVLFHRHIAIRFLLDFWLVLIYKCDSSNDHLEIRICHKCHDVLCKYLQQHKGQKIVVARKQILKRAEFELFVNYVATEICQFCHKIVLLIPFHMQVDDIILPKDDVIKDEKVFRALDIPFNWPPL